MTIGLGFLCDDAWIILLADRQVGSGDFKFYERKISLIALWTGVVAYTYAGRSDVNNSIFEELGQRIRNTDKSVAEIKQDLQATLNSVLTPETSPFQMLVGIDSDRPALFKTFDKTISPVYRHDFIGFGDSALVRYLTANLMKAGIDLHKEQAILCGIYIVAQAKRYVQDCGGTTDIVGLFCGDCHEVPAIISEAIEKQFDNFEYRASTVLAALTKRSILQEQVDKTVADFAQYLREFQAQLRAIQIMPSTSRKSEQGP